jgi:hypothetical protein
MRIWGLGILVVILTFSKTRAAETPWWSMDYLIPTTPTGKLLERQPSNPSPKIRTKQESIARMLSALGLEESTRALVPVLLAQFREMSPGGTVEFWEEFERRFTPDKILSMAAAIYSQHFTQNEIDEIADFYESATGRKVAVKFPQMYQEMVAAGQALGREIRLQVEEKYGVAANPLKAQPFRASQPQEPKPLKLPDDVRFLIIVRDGERQNYYYSSREPKPYGSGFKFLSYGTKAEITVSGNVLIHKLQ